MNIYAVIKTDTNEVLGTALENDGMFLSHLLEEGEAKDTESLIAAVEAAGEPPVIYFILAGSDADGLVTHYAEKGRGVVHLEHIGVAEYNQ